MSAFHHLCLLFLVLFHFSEGKPCPEDTKAHQSRCETYYKCRVLDSGSHVWVPTQCERGLVYEPGLRLCVLPGDDWECNLESDETTRRNDNGFELYPTPKRRDPIKAEHWHSSDLKKEYFEVKSGPVSNMLITSETLDSEEDFESSGDDANEIFEIEVREAEDIELPMQSKVDPKLTSQLQVLSQLITGLKQTYQSKESPNGELRPDQLNAFLAHYNLKSEFDSLAPDHNKEQVPEDGKIRPDVIKEIIKKQERLNKIGKNSTSGTNIKIGNSQSGYGGSVVKVTPKDKVILHNISPSAYNPLSNGYSNAQIVVNRPAGSVMFSLPSEISSGEKPKNEPHISEDTLKTVLELSKQMVANQNIRQVIPKNGFYQSVQPFYYPVPIPTYQKYHNDDDDGKYEKISSATFVANYPSRIKPAAVIQNSVIPVHIGNGGSYQQQQESQWNQATYDSYGNQASDYIDYPPLHGNHFSANPYQNQNKEVTEHPMQAGPPLYTPSPHLDNSNANNVVTIERYPTLPVKNSPSFFEFPTRQRYDQNSHSRPDPYILREMDTSAVKIRPNSYSSPESAEQIESSEDTTHNSVNKKIVSDLLASNVDQAIHSSSSTLGGHQLVNLGGSYISFDAYKNQILPTLSGGLNDVSNLEVISCGAAVRQANTSDCTRYFVCSKKDGKVLSYSCPPYTAFNAQTRICDAKTYALCNPQALFNRFTVADNRKIQMEALQALQEAKRIRDEAIQAQNLANLIRLETQKVINSTFKETPNQGLQEPSILVANYINEVQSTMSDGVTTTTTSRPFVLYGHKKRKYYCKEGDKIPDQTSVLNYYVCYKTKEGVMKGHKMTCSSGLMFCAKSAMCTLPRRCNA